MVPFLEIDGRSLQDLFCKKDILRNFAKLIGKYLCQRILFDKVAGLRPATSLKKESLVQVFSCEFCKISKNTFFLQNTSGGCFWLVFLEKFHYGCLKEPSKSSAVYHESQAIEPDLFQLWCNVLLFAYCMLLSARYFLLFVLSLLNFARYLLLAIRCSFIFYALLVFLFFFII